MKKTSRLFLALAAASTFTFSSCIMMFFQPGYWQSLFARMNSGEKVSSVPASVTKDYLTAEWEEATVQEITEFWNLESYKSKIQNPPSSIDLYVDDAGADNIVLYEDLSVIKILNTAYSRDVSEWIYSINGYVALNLYYPSYLDENFKIFKAKNNSELIKFVHLQKSVIAAEYDVETTSIYKNGFLVFETDGSSKYYVKY